MHVCHWGPVTDGPPRDGTHRVLPELQAPAEAVPKRRQSWYPPYFIVFLSWCFTLCMINFQNKTMHKRDRGPAFDCPSRNGAYRVLPELSTSAEVVPRWSKSWYWTANLKEYNWQKWRINERRFAFQKLQSLNFFLKDTKNAFKNVNT